MFMASPITHAARHSTPHPRDVNAPDAGLVRRFLEDRRRSDLTHGRPLQHAAILIQARWRGGVMARWYRYTLWQRATITIQRRVRHTMRLRPPSVALAASKVQRSWRAHASRQIFAYLRGMIEFRETAGDASQLLRCINPREAQLMADASLSSHVRFRLGGASFPPSIYYKVRCQMHSRTALETQRGLSHIFSQVFTHGAITDVGAFAPRDYTAARKQPWPGSRSSTPRPDSATDQRKQQTVADKRAGWYSRVENNGWRLVLPRRRPAYLQTSHCSHPLPLPLVGERPAIGQL